MRKPDSLTRTSHTGPIRSVPICIRGPYTYAVCWRTMHHRRCSRRALSYHIPLVFTATSIYFRSRVRVGVRVTLTLTSIYSPICCILTNLLAFRDQLETDSHFFIEECDHMQGMQVFVDIADAFGGLASGTLDSIFEEHGTISRTDSVIML